MRGRTYKHWTSRAPERCVPLELASDARVSPIEPAEETAPPETIALDDRCGDVLPAAAHCTTRPFQLVELENARVFSHHGVVIDSQNQLISELTHEFNSYPLGNRVCHYDGLPPIRKIEGSVLVLPTVSSWKNYYHWVVESLPRLRGLDELVQSVDHILVPGERPFHTAWLDLVGIPPSKRLVAANDTHLLADHLIAPTPAEAMINSKAAITWLQRYLPEPTRDYPERIYVTRADSWRRHALNEDQITKALIRDFGFEFISLTGMDAIEQAQRFAAAKSIIAPHGAALGNIAFCRPGAKLLELFPSDFIYPQYYRLAALAGVRYAGHSSFCTKKETDFNLEIDSLKPLLAEFLQA